MDLWHDSMHHLTTIDFSRNEIVMPFFSIAESDHIFSINIAGTRTKDYDGIENANAFFRELYADHTPISGSIPSEIMGVKTLRALSLQGCDLSGELSDEIFNLLDIRELYLADNNLRGNLPDRWDELEHLEVLGLAKNRFTGPLPSSLDRATSLIAVSLQDQTTKGGGLSGAIPSMSTTTTVRTLILADNKLEGDLPDNLLTAVDGSMPVTVDLSNNLVTGKVHGTYDRFKKMNFYLEGNFITEVEEILCNQANWMQGGVGEYGCDAILCPAGTMGGRRAYTDSVCRPCDQSASAFLGQATCSKDPSKGLSERDILELLHDNCGGTGWNARDNWMSERPVCDWYGIACDESGSVTSVQLGGNQLTGSFPTEIYFLPKLVHLKLYTNSLSFSFEGIENAKNLKTLGIDNTGLTSLHGIGRARSLEELNVAFNKLSGPIPEEFSRLVNLRVLDISRNNLNGYLPYWLRSLVSLSTFSASYNKFTGPIYDFGSLGELVYLDLSHNQFSGSVPGTLFQKASRDEKLVADLSSNLLTGRIPGELNGLPRLSLLVQNNEITGIDTQLCEIKGWNDGAVQEFGCNAILCPAGTWNPLGRQTSEESACVDCGKGKFMGSARCGRSSTAPVATIANPSQRFLGALSVLLASILLL
jgi:Leucine-rich repeat (LRR) protein